VNSRVDSALSDALGAVVLVSVVALGIAIGGMILLSNPPADKVPAISADITTIGRDIVISHNGGDTIRKTDMQIVVDGEDLTSRFTRTDGSGWTAWSVGDYLNYTVPQAIPDMPRGVTIYYRSGKAVYLIHSMGVPSAASGTSLAAPVAAFSADRYTGSLPLTVQFTDQSAGSAPLTYAWTFGDGGVSSLRNPSHQYTAPGIYTVRLLVTNGAGSDDEIKTGLITAGDPPIAAFTSDKRTGITPLTINFDGSPSTGSPVLSYAWDFNNDGITDSTIRTPSFTYYGTGNYTVKLTVTNLLGTDDEVKVDYIRVTPNPPWKCGWGYRKNITIDKARVSGSLSGFPVLIDFASDPDLRAHALSSGNDILFTSSDGTTKLPHEIEKFTLSNGALSAWVRVPAIQSSANTTIYMYYGNATAANQQDPAGVWTGYKAVWHMSENPSGSAPQILDSTSNAYHGTSGGAMTPSQQVPAKINGGLIFDGSNDNLTTNYYQTGISAYSIESWIKTSTTSTINGIVQDRGFDEATHGTGMSLTLSLGGTYHGGPTRTGNIAYGIDSNSIWIGRYTVNSVNDNTWHHVVGTWAGGGAVTPSQFSIYIDGIPAATTDATTGSATPPFSGLPGFGTHIADHLPWDTHLPATLDEMRISTTPLSSDWVKTEYNDQNSPSTFAYRNDQEEWTCL
jgi:PKD repeat protein